MIFFDPPQAYFERHLRILRVKMFSFVLWGFDIPFILIPLWNTLLFCLIGFLHIQNRDLKHRKDREFSIRKSEKKEAKDKFEQYKYCYCCLVDDYRILTQKNCALTTENLRLQALLETSMRLQALLETSSSKAETGSEKK